MSASAPVAHPWHLDLSFAAGIRRTVPQRRRYRWPFTLGRGFYLDANAADLLTMVVQTASGSINSADETTQRICVQPEAAVRLVAQGATSVYRARHGERSHDAVELEVATDGYLEYLPQPRILFSGSDLVQSCRAWVATGGTAVYSDSFVFGDPRGAARLRSTTSIVDTSGLLLAEDTFDLDCAAGGIPGQQFGYSAYGSCFFVLPDHDLTTLEPPLRACVQAPGAFGALCVLPNDAGVVIRIAALDGDALRRRLAECIEVFAEWRIATAHDGQLSQTATATKRPRNDQVVALQTPDQ